MISKKVTLILIICLIKTSCDARKSRSITERLNVLERRMNSESSIRYQDIATIFRVIDDLDKRMNESLELRQAPILSDREKDIAIGYVAEKHAVNESYVEELKYDIGRLFRAFQQEKKINAEIRDILPEIRNKLEQNEKLLADVKSDNEDLNAHQQELARDNERLEKELQDVADNMTMRIQELHEKIDGLLTLNYTDLQDKVLQNEIRKPRFSSCYDALINGWKTNGVYEIQIRPGKETIQVYCDQVTNNGGWIVFQRRMDGSENFYRGWEEYRTGFGNLETEFWLGNDFLHEITVSGKYELRIDMEDFEGNKAYAEYKTFKIHSESEKYKLEVGGYQGNASDSLIKNHNGRNFTTFEKDHDLSDTVNCAEHYTGAWWFSDCYASHLNGKYIKTGQGKGIIWYYWKKSTTSSLKFVEMKMREKTI